LEKPIDSIDLSLYEVVIGGCSVCCFDEDNGGACKNVFGAEGFGCSLITGEGYKLKKENAVENNVNVGTFEVVFSDELMQTVDLESIPTGQKFICIESRRTSLYVKMNAGAVRISDGMHWNTGTKVHGYQPVSVKIEVYSV
jgi:hypothetical protein